MQKKRGAITRVNQIPEIGKISPEIFNELIFPRLQEVVETLGHKGIASSIVGELINPKEGIILVEKGKGQKLRHPIVDPFWKAFYGALEKYAS